MYSVLYKACLVSLLSISCLHGSQAPQENATTDTCAEKKVLASPEEAELCDRLFGLQSECELKHQHLYTTLGGAFGVLTAAVGRSSTDILKCMPQLSIHFFKNIPQLSMKLLRCSPKLCLFGAAGLLLGAMVRSIAQTSKTQQVLTEKTTEYIPEEYMAHVQETLEHGEHVYIHKFKGSENVVEVNESDIQKWHELATSGHCVVCHKHPRTGQLIADLPYYSLATVTEGDPLLPLVSYDREQKVKLFDVEHQLINASFEHDPRQNRYGCEEGQHFRKIGLPTLGRYINHGKIDGAEPLVQEVYYREQPH